MRTSVTVLEKLFAIELQHEDDGRWSVWCPELAGCASWAFTALEAKKRMIEAIEAYVGDVGSPSVTN